MALGADVLVETFRPGVMERLGLGYEDLATENPRLVYGSVSGFGRMGPYANAKAYEALVMARVGALWASQSMVAREGPAHVSVPYCSYGASQQLLAGICAALHERERSGEGQRVEATLVNGLASLGTWNWYLNVITSKFPDAFTPSSPFGKHGLPLSPMTFMLLIALSKDGRWMQFSQVQLHLYMEMLKVFGLDWMLQDEEWKDAVWAADNPKTGEYWDKLYEAVQSKTLAEWNEVFETRPQRVGRDHAAGQRVVGPPADAASRCRGRRSTTPSAGWCASRARSSRCGRPRPSLGRGAPVLDADGAAVRADPWAALGARRTSWPGRARRRTAGRWATSPCSRSAPSSPRRSRARCCASWEPG